MPRRVVPIALAALALAGCDSSEPDTTTEAAPRPASPAGTCPPPGPAAIDPSTGRLLCGEEARRYVREQQRRQAPSTSLLRRGRRIAAADPALSAILRGHEYRFAQIGGWSAGDGSTEVLGVGGNIELDDPIAVRAVLPYVCAGDPAKGSGRRRVVLRNVTQLHFLAHFASERVVEISPGAKLGGPRPQGSGQLLPGSAKCPPSRGD